MKIRQAKSDDASLILSFIHKKSEFDRSIWLDDLHVNEDCRSQGVGAALMAQLAHIAQENDCTHIAWNADARNQRGLSFY